MHSVNSNSMSLSLIYLSQDSFSTNLLSFMAAATFTIQLKTSDDIDWCLLSSDLSLSNDLFQLSFSFCSMRVYLTWRRYWTFISRFYIFSYCILDSAFKHPMVYFLSKIYWPTSDICCLSSSVFCSFLLTLMLQSVSSFLALTRSF